ncbi:hypothetical protein BH11CYA1_BH11CYA1_05140 [soil metagenome]
MVRFLHICLLLSLGQLLVSLPALSAVPSVEIEKMKQPERREQRVEGDRVSATLHGHHLLVKIEHQRGIGRARLLFHGLNGKEIDLQVRFCRFSMLEGFTTFSGAKEIYCLTNSRSKKRKFSLQVPASREQETIELSWVDAYRH